MQSNRAGAVNGKSGAFGRLPSCGLFCCSGWCGRCFAHSLLVVSFGPLELQLAAARALLCTPWKASVTACKDDIPWVLSMQSASAGVAGSVDRGGAAGTGPAEANGACIRLRKKSSSLYSGYFGQIPRFAEVSVGGAGVGFCVCCVCSGLPNESLHLTVLRDPSGCSSCLYRFCDS